MFFWCMYRRYKIGVVHSSIGDHQDHKLPARPRMHCYLAVYFSLNEPRVDVLLHPTVGERDNGRRRSSGGREDPRHVNLRAVKQMLAEVRPRVVAR